MAESRTPTRPEDHTESTADLLKRLSEQTSKLVSAEIELAKAEVSAKGKQAGIGAGPFGGAGVFGLYALGALTATAIAALATAVDTWLAALIVTIVWAVIAGIMALTGKSRVQKAMPPVPQHSVDSVKEDVQGNAMKEGLPGGTLRVFTEERARGGPSSCCTLDWI
jgi:hypothetical protein